MNNVVLSEGKEMVDALNKFQSVFALENENNITALHCQSVTSEEISDNGDVFYAMFLLYFMVESLETRIETTFFFQW